MNRSENIADLATALAKAQGEIKNAPKDASNPHFKSRYADLESVWTACRAALAKNELAVAQITETDDDGSVVVETVLMHSSGQLISGRLAMKPQQFTPQAIGSVITYSRRYALAAMVGVAPEAEDDDGEGAEGRNGTGGASIGTPVKSGGKPKSAPPVPDATKDDSMREVYAQIMQGIKVAETVGGLNALMKARAPDLEAIKAKSEEGYARIMKRSTDRMAELSQTPIGEAA